MTRRDRVQAALLLAVLILTLPPLAHLAKGRTPSLLVPANLPFWERRPPRPIPLKGVRRVSPAPPGSIEFLDPNVRILFWNADEDLLLRPLEHPDADPHDDTTRAGRWLEMACSLGRADPVLRGKQDRVASRLIGAQLSNGWFGKDPGIKRRDAMDWDAQAFSLRGLLAFYAVTHNPAAIYAAEACADEVVRTPLRSVKTRHLLLPVAILCRQTGNMELVTWCRRAIRAGREDVAGECALYEMTGEKGYLTAARVLLAPTSHIHNMMQKDAVQFVQQDAAGGAAMWTDTGDVHFLPLLRAGGGLTLCPLTPGTLAYGRIPRGIRVVVWMTSRASFGDVRLAQTRNRLPDGLRRVTFTIHVPKPTAFLLNVPPCASAALLNGKPIAFSGTLLRRWRNGDVLTVQAK